MSVPTLRSVATKERKMASKGCTCALAFGDRHMRGFAISARRNLVPTAATRATTLPITGAGPPPSAPSPKLSSGSSAADRVASHRRKAALLETAKEIRASQAPTSSSKSPLKKRFWQSVYVKETPEGYQIFLDKRPVRTPNKDIITIPLSKPNLAHAIAIEWDMLNSAQEALKNHKIPMTSIVSRALDIQAADTTQGVDNDVRQSIVQTMLRYLDTDTLLCWAPEQSSVEAAYGSRPKAPSESSDSDPPRKSLRDLQTATARPIISFLTSTIWPGVSITPTLDPDSIIPQKQSEVTRSVIEGWITGLPAYELAALERAVLATKSLLVAARLVVEWSEEFRGLQTANPESTGNPSSTVRETISASVGGKAAVESSTDETSAAAAAGLAEGESRFGIESAARAATLEVSWQTGMWGEVEDTHDVEKEDVRRQLGSAVLIVAGKGR